MRVMQMGKIRVNLTIDEEVKKKAEELGLNLSKVAENALKEAVRRLEAKDSQEDLVFSVNAFGEKGSWCGRWDSDPRRPAPQGPEPCALDQTWQLPRANVSMDMVE